MPPLALLPSVQSPVHRRIILLLATLLIANPAILFLLARNVWVGIGVPLAAVVVLQWLATRPAGTLLTAYVFNVFAVVSVFAHAEVLILYGFPDYVVENIYTIEDGYYFNEPMLDQTFSSKEYVVRYRTNAQGFRIGSGQDPARTYADADWLVIGDSFTQGAQVDFSELYTTQLNQRFPDKVIINAGISGLGVGHEYNYFAKEAYKHSPSLVILQLCSFNDFMNVEPRSVGFTDRLMTHSAFLRYLLADFKFTNPAQLPLGRWTEPFHADAAGNVDFNIFYKETSPTKARDLEAFQRYLTQFRDSVESKGARLLVVLIPTKEQVHQRYLDEVVREFSIDPSRLNMRRPNEMMATLTAGLRIDYIDLLPAFQAASTSPFFAYDEHLTATGHRVMADAIAMRLAENPNGSAVRTLSDGTGADRYPMLSQDGSLMTYQSFRDGNMELFLATVDLRERRRVTFDDVDQSHPMLSQDNTRLVFTEGSQESQRTEVVLTGLDGSQRTVLTSGPNTFGAIPTFSRSNLQIAYAEWTYDDASRQFSLPRIVVFDVVSAQKRYLTPAVQESWRPVFSPDGTRLYYISKANGQFDVYSHEFASGLVQQLTRTPFDEWDPQVSPDGAWVVYAARVDNNWDLFVLNVSDGVSTRLTTTKGDEWDPAFTPDGRSILFGGRFGLTDGIFEIAYRP